MPDMRLPLVLLLCSALVMASEDKQACPDNAETQQQISQCADLDNQAADRELNQVYQAVIKQHAGDKTFTDNLKLAQRAWLKWRDAEMAATYPHAEEAGYYGSALNACWATQLASLTRERSRQLRKWLDGVEEGELCSGSLPIKASP